MNIPSFGAMPKMDWTSGFDLPQMDQGWTGGFDLPGGGDTPGGWNGAYPGVDTNGSDWASGGTNPGSGNINTPGLNVPTPGGGGGSVTPPGGFKLPFGMTPAQLAMLAAGGGAALYGTNASNTAARDVNAAATAQGENNIATAGRESQLNNPNMVTPYGSSTYTIGPDGRPVLTQSLSPAEQANLEATQRLTGSRLGAASGMLPGIEASLRGPFGLGGAIPTADAGTLDAAERAMYSRGAQYLDPQFRRSGEDLRTRLANQGITPGSAAYQRAVEEEGLRSQKAYSDLRDQAVAQGLLAEKTQFDMGLAGRQQGYNEYTQNRQIPIQLLNQISQGATVNNPQFQPTQGTRIQPAPIYNAGVAGANLQQGNVQNLFNLLSRFGGAFLNQPTAGAG